MSQLVNNVGAVFTTSDGAVVVSAPRNGDLAQFHFHRHAASEKDPLLPNSSPPSVSDLGTLSSTHDISQKPNTGPGSAGTWGSALAAEAAYCFISAGTILFNKHALSHFEFPAPNALLTFQFTVAVVLLKILNAVGWLHLEPLRWDMARLWLPVNLIFVAMNITGFYALMSVTAGMFTVLKNLANLLTIGGDYLFFGKVYSWQVWACLALMIFSAGLGGWSDVSFSASGYAWQLINCGFTAAYSLYLSKVVRQAGAAGHGKRPQLSELSMVYYNNVLSVPPLALLTLLTGELPRLRTYPHFDNVAFHAVALMGALVGFGVSFASIWCMSRTSATLYSLTGSMNKVIVAVVGLWIFQEPASLLNLVSIGMGLAAGFLFVFAKTGTSGPVQSSSGSGSSNTGVGLAIAMQGPVGHAGARGTSGSPLRSRDEAGDEKV